MEKGISDSEEKAGAGFGGRACLCRQGGAKSLVDKAEWTSKWDCKWNWREKQGSEHGKILRFYSKYGKMVVRFEKGNDIS